MDEVITTTLAMPPEISAMIRQEAKDTGNSFASIIRRRVLDSYRREAKDLGYTLVGSEVDESEPAHDTSL